MFKKLKNLFNKRIENGTQEKIEPNFLQTDGSIEEEDTLSDINTSKKIVASGMNNVQHTMMQDNKDFMDELLGNKRTME